MADYVPKDKARYDALVVEMNATRSRGEWVLAASKAVDAGVDRLDVQAAMQVTAPQGEPVGAPQLQTAPPGHKAPRLFPSAPARRA